MTHQQFINPKLIRFRHCDPAGIVYYPRYYELLHETQEDFLAHIGHPEPAMIAAGVGVPVVNMQTDFVGMSRHGDRVHVALELWKLGATSIGMRYEIRNALDANDVRLRAKAVVVVSGTALGAKSQRMDEALRAALMPYLNTQSEAKT